MGAYHGKGLNRGKRRTADWIRPGMTVMAETRSMNETVKASPWGSEAVPVKVKEEYEFFFVAIVMPHRRKWGLGISVPYTVTLDKRDIRTGELVIREREE